MIDFKLGNLALLGMLTLAPLAVRAEEAEFDCVIDPSTVIRVGSPVIGILEEVPVRRGDVVKKGEVVARMESGVEVATVSLDRLRARSTAEIEAQEARLALIRNRHERSSVLAKSNIVTKDRMEQLRADLKVGERELSLKRTEKKLAELELHRSEAILERRTIRAPIDGLVTERHLSQGEYVNQDSKIVTIARLNPLHVETFVRVSYWGRIEVGMTGAVMLPDPIGGSYPAQVTVVDRVFDAASGTFGVRLELANPENRLPAGQRCRVAFPLQDMHGAGGG